MAADGTPGARKQPQFLGGGAPATAVDLNILADHTAEMGNSMALSTADREAFESDGWEGLFCYDTDEDAIYRHDGSAWVVFWHDWKAYTPTATNASGGTLAGTFMRLGKTIHVGVRHLSPTITGQPTYLLPVAAADTATYWFDGGGVARDNSPATEFQLVARKISDTSVGPYLLAIPTTYTQFANVSATVPFTWATNDFIDLRFSYEAAA
tara:strand:- start:1831 stop:2460 length:630 start_codon:yes stop_codon:yes gene_type:complete